MVNVGERGKLLAILVGVAMMSAILMSNRILQALLESRRDANLNDLHISGDMKVGGDLTLDAQHTLTDTQGIQNEYQRLKRSATRETESADYLFLEWSEWENCSSKQCDLEGVQWRYRFCLTTGYPNSNVNPCGFENLTQFRPCFAEGCDSVIIEGHSWSDWAEWGLCSVTCGQGGVQERSRTCQVNGVQKPSRSCRGMTLERRDCQYSAGCPKMEEWSPWSPCSNTCGSEGISTRKRDCVVYRNFISGHTDPDNKTNTTEEITLYELSNEDIADGAIVYRNNVPIFIVDARSDLNVESSAFLPDNTFKERVAIENCIAINQSFEEHKTCRFEGNCPSQWAPWQAWSACRKVCTPTFQKRMRQCLVNSRNRNEPCQGLNTVYRRCASTSCWSQWVNIGECSATCGVGVQRRIRDCRDNLFVTIGVCSGPRKSVINCSLETCSNDEWTPWSQFTKCTVSCNRGWQFRNRTCLKKSCIGMSNDLRVCNPQRCPFWSRWKPYSCCSVSCGEGVRMRTRTCVNGGVGNTGCDGETKEINPCYLPPCQRMAEDVNIEHIPCGKRGHLTLKTVARLRIFQGRKSSPHSWPWQGSWQHRQSRGHPWKHFCGVTLIHSRWVVTAAHCIEDAIYTVDHDNPGIFWSVVLGIHKVQDDGRRLFADKVIVHQKYSRQIATYSDIALVKLREFIAITDKISPICLRETLEPRIGESCTISGWGQQFPNGPYSNILMEAEIPIIGLNECKSLGDSYRYFLSKSVHMCAGNPNETSADSCTGDSGGPLACRDGDEWYLAGVTSFAFTHCGKIGHSGIYTRIQNFVQWIKDTVSTNTYERC